MGDSLKATHEKDNFQRLARLLFCGGRQLLKEVFDSHFSPIALTPALQRFLARPGCSINPRERSCLNPSPGVYGKSADFDITLLFKLVRHLCNLTIPATGWDSLPNSVDDTLSADLARIKFYRNKICHDNNNMEIDNAAFLSLWQEISEAIVRIAESISDEKRNEWKTQIDSLLNNPLTVDEEMEIKKELQDVKSSLNQCTDEIRDFREEVRESLAALNMKIDIQTKSQGMHRTQSIVPDSVVGSAGYQDGTQGASLYPHPPVTAKQILSLIAHYYVQVKPPSSSHEFSGFSDYMTKMEVAIQNLTIGSLLITLSISTLPILERLWKDYRSGRLGEVVQKLLATDEIMNDLGLTVLKLKTTILEEDYRACKQSLKESSDKDASGIEHCTISPIKEQAQTSTKRSASKALTGEGINVVKVEKEESAFKHRKLTKLSGGGRDSGDASDIEHCTISPIKEQAQTSTKRSASEAFTGINVVKVEKEETAFKHRKLTKLSGGGSDSEVGNADVVGTYEEAGSISKHSKLKLTEASESQSESEDLDEDLNREVVFAIDCTSDVSEKEFQQQIHFVKNLAKSLNETPGSSRASLIAYGDDCQTLIPLGKDGATHFSVQLGNVGAKPEFHGKGRRIDLALNTAADIFKSTNRSSSWKQYQEEKDQLVILTTAGMQSWSDPLLENPDALSSVAESLQKENVKVILVSVGSGVNFEELVQVIERPYYLFPFLSFNDLTEIKAQEIAEEILQTADIVKYTKRKVMSFSGVNPDCGLGEKISECLDVMEGAWNLLYRQENFESGVRAKKVIGPARKRIQQGLGDFHGRLVLDSNITINIAVFGTEGAGKSTMFNFLLNHGVPSNLLNDGPLPSGKGSRQTRLPIYIKYANSLQVLLHKDRDALKPEVLFPNSELEVQSENQLTLVRDCLKKFFHMENVLEDATHIELQGPFPIFRYLEERRITSSNHLESEVNVQLVDLPGLREDQKGNKVLISELSKADLILFFTSGQEGREVTPHDLANVFRQHGNFDFPSRPKLIHLVKASASDNFDVMHQVNQGVLEKVWKEFFEDVEGNKCYQLAREKLPSLGGEDLLNKLKEESEVLVFHPQNAAFLPGLKEALRRHIKNVKTKKAFHPSLKDLHRLAKNLNKTIPSSASRARKAPQDFIKVTVDNPPFEIIPDEKEEEDLIESFLATDEDILQQEDIEGVYEDFMYADETSRFVQERLQTALNDVSDELIASVENGYRNASMDISDILRVLAEMFCDGKVQRYCAHRALRYFHWVLENSKVGKPTSKERKAWSTCHKEDRKGLLTKLLVNSLGKVLKRLETARGCGGDISPLKVREFLKNGIEELFSVRSLENVPSKPDFLKGKLKLVIDFSRGAIRDCNPEFDLSSLDSYDHTKDFPEQLRMRSIDNFKPSISCAHERITKEMVQLLKTKKGDPVRELEKKLKFEKSEKALAPPQNVEPGKWPLALLTVLSDKDHFDVPLDDDFALDDETLRLARKRLFPFQRSRVECQIAKTDSIPGDEIHVQKHTEQPNVLQVSMTSETQKDLDKICTGFTDCKIQLAPIFIPTIRPGPQLNRMGNYFLQEDPWKNENENETENVDESACLEFNIFLVVEEQHLGVLKSTIAKKAPLTDRKINLKFIVLPQNGYEAGVTKAIIKSLAECFKFDLYWTVDDDINFMYQFSENDRRWHKCTFGRGLLFGQRVFQHCRQPALKQLSAAGLDNLVDDVLDLWPKWAKKSRSLREARSRLLDEAKLQKLRDSPGLLHSPFTDEIISEDCGEDDAKKEKLKEVERKFVEQCRNSLFEDAVNHIAGVSLAHKITGKSDYMGNYPSAHFMPSTQRYQVVLHNAPALKGRNYVSDEMIFLEQEDQITEKARHKTGYWGIKHFDKSFSRALEVSGIFGYQVICINHIHKNGLVDAYEAIGPSYEDSMSPYASEEEV